MRKTPRSKSIHYRQFQAIIGDYPTFPNLIGNALKFSAADAPRIAITAQSTDDHWVFGVQDNGIGIEPKQQERIFEPFVRLHTRESYEGSGFGLSICKKAVDKHGGRIWVESTPGEGAHFKFSLPAQGVNNN